jgi:hypothetical protein
VDYTYPHVPVGRFGLLYASRQIYNEASSILYRNIHLGSDPESALDYLTFIGPARFHQIQNLTVFYQCHWDLDCTTLQSQNGWTRVFELLWQSWACVRYLNVHFAPHVTHLKEDKSLRTRCLFEFDEELDCFWWSLRLLTMVQEIRIKSPVPEYFAYQHANRLGWPMEGKVANTQCPESFVGRLVNPTFPSEYDWIAKENTRLDNGGDASGIADERYHVVNTPASSTYLSAKNILDLPVEIRRMIYDFACETWVYKPFWPTRPARWNTGIGLLLTCRGTYEEALPSLYRTFRVNGGTPLKALEILGPNINHAQTLEVHFSCFCPSGPDGMQLNNETIYAAQNPAAPEDWEHQAPPTAWYTTDALVRQYEDEWTKAMRQIQEHTSLRHLAVTFVSCCRSAAPSWPWWVRPQTSNHAIPTEIQQYRSCCRALEDRFVNLLVAAVNRTNKVSLAGDVPPSLALRLVSSGLSLKRVSKAMTAFMRDTAKDRKEWTESPNQEELPWAKTKPIPLFVYNPREGQAPHFVLEREQSAISRWTRLVGPEEMGPLEEGMDLVKAPRVSGTTWEEVSEIMDYDNVAVVVGEDGSN